MTHVCRFCSGYMREDEGVRYGKRHWAHFDCYLTRKTLGELRPWQIGTFPIGVLRKYNLMDEATQRTSGGTQ